MPNNSGSDGGERRIKDLLGLVKFCLETTSKEDASGDTPSNFEVMDPDRRAWLQNAINSMTVDTTKQLLENLASVKETIAYMEKDPTHNVPVQKTCDALGVLTDLCEEIDYAADFAKLDGFTIFIPLIGCSHEEMIVKACELIAALAQNNPLCQTMAVQTRLLEKLIDFVHMKDDQTHIKARSYALYAISSIVRSNPEVRKHFESRLDGLSVLYHLLDCTPSDKMIESRLRAGDYKESSSVNWWRKLRIRSVFLFRTLCSESNISSNYFYDHKAIIKIKNQLSVCCDVELREHLLQALKIFIESLSVNKQKECLKLAPDLKEVIMKVQETCEHHQEDDCDITDTRIICKELLGMIDGTCR